MKEQWHYNNTGAQVEGSIAGADINLYDAWEIETGKPNVIVCIVDGGIKTDHADLAANIWINQAEANGEEGVAQAKAHLPDLILMDVVMPVLNGFQATRRIRKYDATAHIHIIIISGEQQPTELYWGKRVGANCFLTKPVHRALFFKTIFEALKSDEVIKN